MERLIISIPLFAELLNIFSFCYVVPQAINVSLFHKLESEKMPFEDNDLDVVISVNALDHVDNLKNSG